jgi:hypothetical protein
MLYKYIDIPYLEDIQRIIPKYLPELYKTESKFTPESPEPFSKCWQLVKAIETLTPWSNVQGIVIISCSITPPFDIHTDNYDTTYALNIPLLNCEDSYTLFYKVKDGQVPVSKAVEQTHNLPYTFYRPDQVEVIDKMYLHKAALFNVNVPHKPVTETDSVRLILSVRFFKEVFAENADVAK